MTVPTIKPADMGAITESNAPLLLDVRTPSEFAAVHARGARSMPLDSLDPAEVSALAGGANQPVYVICHSGARSAKACEALLAAGLHNVRSVEGGTTAWERAGLPVLRGSSRTLPLEQQARLGAGLVAFIGVTLTWFVHPYFLIVPTFVACGLMLSGLTGFCGMAIILSKMPWNRASVSLNPTCTLPTNGNI